jgi:hypothetical protein
MKDSSVAENEYIPTLTTTRAIIASYYHLNPGSTFGARILFGL